MGNDYGRMVSQWWRNGGGTVEQKQFLNREFRVYKSLNLGKRPARTTRGERCGKNWFLC